MGGKRLAEKLLPVLVEGKRLPPHEVFTGPNLPLGTGRRPETSGRWAERAF
jgi:hypothetical protein